MSHSRNSSPPPSLQPQARSETFSTPVVLSFQACHINKCFWDGSMLQCVSAVQGVFHFLKILNHSPQHTRLPSPHCPKSLIGLELDDRPQGSSGLSRAVSQALVAALRPFWCHLCGTSSFCPKPGCWSVGCCFSAELSRARAAAMGRWTSSEKAVVSQTGGSGDWVHRGPQRITGLWANNRRRILAGSLGAEDGGWRLLLWPGVEIDFSDWRIRSCWEQHCEQFRVCDV